MDSYSAKEILREFGGMVDGGMAFSPLIRLLLLAFIIFCYMRKKIYVEYLAAYVGLLLIGAAIMTVGFKEFTNPPMFFILFALGLLWGREALVLPPHPKPKKAYLVIAGVFTLIAFFYPHFVTGKWGPILGPILIAPMGVLPGPSLIIPQAAIIATRRSYSLYTAIPTWVVGALFGLMGVFYLGKPLDFALLAAVAVSVIVYVLAPSEEGKHRSKKLKRH
jgi:hypothetical protein